VVVILFGALNIVWGASEWLPLTLAALAAAGFVDMISVNIRATTVALVTPNELRGRVGAVEMVFISASNELGAFESGAVAALFGAVTTVVAGGIATIGIALASIKLFPRPRADGEARGPTARAGSYAREMSVDRRSVWPYVDGDPGEFMYSRYANPTGLEAERKLGELEGGQALLFSSGSAATLALLLALMEPGPDRCPRRGLLLRHGVMMREELGRWGLRPSSSTRPVRRRTAPTSSGSRRRRTRS
jgi:hypothetical protein